MTPPTVEWGEPPIDRAAPVPHRGHMLLRSALLSLVPLAAFVTVVGMGDGFAFEGAFVVLALPLYAGFVSAPSFFPIAVAKAGWLQWAVTAVMTATAIGAGFAILGSDDAQAGLAVLLVAYVAVPLGTTVWLWRSVAEARAGGGAGVGQAVPGMHRVAALVVDALVVGAVLAWPVGVLSNAGREIEAAVVACVGATIALAVQVAIGGQTLGHRLLRLRVVDVRDGGGVGLGRAAVRGFVVVGETLIGFTGALAVVALVDFAYVLSGNRSFGDRVARTCVIRAA